MPAESAAVAPRTGQPGPSPSQPHPHRGRAVLARNYFRELKGDAFDPDADVPWSEEKPAAGAWMPSQTIDYLFDALAEER